MNQRHLLALLRRTLPVLLPFSHYESDYAIILFSICFTHFHPCTSPSLFSTFCLIIVTYQRLVSTTCILLSTCWASEWWDCGLPSDTRTPQFHLCAAFSVVHSVLWDCESERCVVAWTECSFHCGFSLVLCRTCCLSDRHCVWLICLHLFLSRTFHIYLFTKCSLPSRLFAYSNILMHPHTK